MENYIKKYQTLGLSRNFLIYSNSSINEIWDLKKTRYFFFFFAGAFLEGDPSSSVKIPLSIKSSLT
jgi:hypothetical protein